MSTTEHGTVIWWERIPFLAASAIIAGLFYSNIAMSLGMMVLLIHPFLGFNSGRFGFSKTSAKRVMTFLKTPEWSAPVLVLVAVLVSGLWSESTDDWAKFARLKLPFLALPMAFFLKRDWSSSALRVLEQLFIGVAVFSTFPVLINLSINYKEITLDLEKGQPIPVPTHHIRYGMLLALASLVGLYRQFYVRSKALRIFFLLAAVWLFIVLLILSTRTGILVLIGGGVYIFIQQAMAGKNWRILIAGFIAAGALILAAFFTVPTMQTRISYMLYDWARMKAGDDLHYSDSERVRSLQAGWAIWKESPWTGTGMGDQKNETVAYYKEQWGLDKHKLPHNQLLFVMSSTGLIGLLLFLAGTLYPLALSMVFRRPELVLLYIVFILAGLVEHTLETTTGITMFCFFLSFYTRWHHTVDASSPAS